MFRIYGLDRKNCILFKNVYENIITRIYGYESNSKAGSRPQNPPKTKIFEHIQLTQKTSAPAGTGQVGSGQVKSGQARSSQVRSGQVK